MSLKPVVNAICDWGKKHQQETENRRALATVGAGKVLGHGAKRAATVRPLRRVVVG